LLGSACLGGSACVRTEAVGARRLATALDTTRLPNAPRKLSSRSLTALSAIGVLSSRSALILTTAPPSEGVCGACALLARPCGRGRNASRARSSGRRGGLESRQVLRCRRAPSADGTMDGSAILRPCERRVALVGSAKRRLSLRAPQSKLLDRRETLRRVARRRPRSHLARLRTASRLRPGRSSAGSGLAEASPSSSARWQPTRTAMMVRRCASDLCLRTDALAAFTAWSLPITQSCNRPRARGP